MQNYDYPRFQALMGMLTVTFGKELDAPLTDIYWEALKPLAIEQLECGTKLAIRHNKHFPRPVDLFQLCKDAIAATPKPIDPLPPKEGKWLCRVNSLFLRYLEQRRLVEEFRGDINLAARRAGCLSLAQFFEDLEVEGDTECTEPELKARFDRAMARVPDSIES